MLAAEPIERRPDRVGLPVTMPRESDGKMHPDGKSAASMQPENAVGECAGLHGAPDLGRFPGKHVAESRKVFLSRKEERRRW
ncbi:hypothetical protein X772_08365 [Mesorhizobium sp. LSJC280B00]|nr:hypothetical protein X772_08365 [Mesorhizobium sp. LSJC280B00]